MTRSGQSSDQKIEKKLQSSLDELDRLAMPATPSLQWFQQFAEEQQRQRRQRFKRELVGFLCIAPIAVGSAIVSMVYGVEVFLLFQIAVFVALASPILWLRKKRINRR